MRTFTPTSSTAASTPPGHQAPDGLSDSAVVDHHLVDTEVAELRLAVSTSRGGDDPHSSQPSQDGERHAHRRGAATDQDALPFPAVHAGGQRSGRRLQHLGQGPEHAPRQAAGEGDHLAGGDAGVLGVPAVEVPAHPAHHRGHLRSCRELTTRCRGHSPDGLDAGYAGEGPRVREPLPEVLLGPVQAERVDLDQHPTGLWVGIGTVVTRRTSGPPGCSTTTARIIGSSNDVQVERASVLDAQSFRWGPFDRKVGAGALEEALMRQDYDTVVCRMRTTRPAGQSHGRDRAAGRASGTQPGGHAGIG